MLSDDEEEKQSPLETIVKEQQHVLVNRLSSMNAEVERLETELMKKRIHAKALVAAAAAAAKEEPPPPPLERLSDIDKKISTMDANIVRLNDELDKKRRQAKAINDDIELFESGNKKAIFYLERVRSGRMSLVWLVTVCLTLLCTFGTFSTHSYGLSAANFVAFLIVWRNLYVQSSYASLGVALVIVVFTIKFF
jgi:uncharacterized small protein (DUF1192 family)